MLSESTESSAGEGSAVLEAWSERREPVPQKAGAEKQVRGPVWPLAGERRLGAPGGLARSVVPSELT